MFNSIIQKLDIANLVLAIGAGYCLLVNEKAYLQGLTMLLAIGMLLVAKYRYTRIHIFLTYFFSLVFFGLLFQQISEKPIFANIEMPLDNAGIILAALLLGAVAAYGKLGSHTLSILWFALHAVMIFVSFRLAGASFFDLYWSLPAQKETISGFYPILLAAMLIGVFFEKYQYEIRHDKMLR